MKFVRTTVITTLSLLAAAYVIPGFVVNNLGVAIIASIVLGLVNAIIRPVMLLLTLPINIITLGLFTFVVNALMIMVAAFFVGGFAVSGFFPALAGSIVISIISYILNTVFKS